MTYRRAYEAIDAVFSDRSVEPEETAARLLSLRLEIDNSLQALRDDGVDVSEVLPAEAP